MDFAIFAQYLASGLLNGGLYALIGVSLVIIYKATKVFNFAVGAMMTLGGMICVSLMTVFGMPIWFALPLAIMASGVLGFFVDKTIMRPLLAQPIITLIMATLAFDSILYGLTLVFWTGYTISFPMDSLPGKVIFLGPVFLSHELMYGFGAAIICFVAVGFLFNKTMIGLRMRATADSHEVAMALGIDITKIFSWTWVLAAMVGALAGIFLGHRVGLQASVTSALAFKALPAIILGGLDSIGGAIIGGLLVGVIEKMAGGYIDPKIAEISPYIILLMVLVVRPEGLFGEKRIERV